MPSTTTGPPSGRAGRAIRLAGGWTLVVSGAALLVLPGPGIPLVLGGLALLAPEQAWAARLHGRLLDRWHRARRGFAARHASANVPPQETGDRSGSPLDVSRTDKRQL
jgi:hypothetical protein